MKIVLLLFLLSAAMTVFAQMPQVVPGVSHDLAIWRAAHYSDVRYKLNLTLEKMSPVLKGTIEIRVNVSDAETRGRGDAGKESAAVPPIVLDWRKIRGSESLSTILNVSINGKVISVENHPVGEAPTPLLRKEGSQNGPPEGETQNGYEESNEHLIFRDGVVAGENVIKLDFTSPILTSGAAVTRYVDKEDGGEYIYSLFVPSDASTAFPVFDQPDLKARFQVTVSHPEEWKIISNSKTPLFPVYESDGPRGSKPIAGPISFFEETEPISTYVFAFASGPFAEFADDKSVPPAVAGGLTRPAKNVRKNASVNLTVNEAKRQPPAIAGGTDKKAARSTDKTANDVPTHVYVRRSQAKKFEKEAPEVFRLTREGMKYLEGYFDFKFPFPKYDLVLIPEFPFGGMEHAGATFLREDRIIFPQEPTKNDYITRANVIFHETAHQWFGDTVTMKWFDDLWLKEGFAEFMAYKTLEKVMPEYNAWKIFYERNKQAAYLTDSTKGTTPIYQPIDNLSAAKSAYGNIVYRKAPSFLRQAEFYLGEDKFKTAVRAFLKKHAFANAGWEDLVREFEAASGQDLKEWANQWVKTPGLTYISDRPFRAVATDVSRVGLRDKYVSGFMFDEGRVPGYWPMKTKAVLLYKDGTRLFQDVDFQDRVGNPAHTKGADVEFIYGNYGDYGYGIFLLDDKSRDYVLRNIQNEKDDFLRSMMWGSLWDSVREGELDPKEYVELVVKNIGVENDESTIATLLNRVSTAMNYYMSVPPAVAGGSTRASETSKTINANRQPPATAGGTDRTAVGHADNLASSVETMLMDNIEKAPTLGQRITFYRAFLNLASTQESKDVLKRMLTGGNASVNERAKLRTGKDARSLTVASLPLKTKDKFDIVTLLLVLSDPDAPKLLADLEKTETSDEAKRYAYAAKAGIATAENKEKFWNDFVNNKNLSESWIESAMGPFNSIRQSELTLPYLERALAELPNLKRNRKIFFVNGWLGAFIGGQRDEKALAIVNKFLADNPNLDKDLRLKILENVDVIERAVKIRNKFPAR